MKDIGDERWRFALHGSKISKGLSPAGDNYGSLNDILLDCTQREFTL